jgi:signal transduction histidine kinase
VIVVARTVWRLAFAVALFALLAALATLQYRWLGQVSDAERERLRSGLHARASEFADDFDRELTRTYLSFQVSPGALDRDAAAALADAYARARAESSIGGIVRTVFLLDAEGPRANVLQQLDPEARALAPAEWQRADHLARLVPGRLSPAFMGDAIDARTPALVVPIPKLQRLEQDGRTAFLPDPGGVTRTVLVWLDEEKLTHRLVDALVRKHFGAPAASEYFVAVVRRDDPAHVVYASDGDAVTARNADLKTGVFDLRIDELNRFYVAGESPRGMPALHDRVAITIVRRAPSPDAPRILMAGGDTQGAWQVLVRPKSGSLEALVAKSRARNLAISLGVLGLLGVSVVLVIGSAQRQQRLARQQMEFVAAVSHELRTPLAVIRSAAENLADGVVADGPPVKSYGALIEAEGRRLTEMVDRVMAFAGITSAPAPRAPTAVDLSAVLQDAVARAGAGGRDGSADIVVRNDAARLPMEGDADALRSAFENVLGNAVKYSPAGARVNVNVTAGDRHVRIIVADRGIGIDRDELPQVFQPFFRGRRAVEAQIRGTGIGLSVVRQVVGAHRGEVRVESEPGVGTTVTIDLPLAS